MARRTNRRLALALANAGGLVGGALLDAAVGDPRRFHPTAGYGRLAGALERRLYSRDWTDEQGTRRTSYELDAASVGHDLSKGVDKFARRKAPGATDMVNDPSGAVAAGGELTEPVDAPGRPEDLPPDNELFEEFDSAVYDTAPIPPPRQADEAPLAPAGV